MALLEGLIGATLVGCSVYSAATRPDYKDTSIVTEGTSRSALINLLGQPCWTHQKEDTRIDVFEVSGAGATCGQKATRTAGYALLDVATLGVGEFWGSELESTVKRQCTTYTVTYGRDDKVQSVETKQWEVEPPPLARERPAGYCGIDYHTPACESKQP
ncbi:MAG TPA: hypothetical protein VK437_15355 [Steroidobacteraceae bacterium]|nr:hypothetical protein [Steroidobacteraceae bacterium]